MNTTIRRGLSAIAIALTALTLFGQTGSSAEAPAETSTTFGEGMRTEVRLSAADTGSAADSFKAAETICYTKVIPAAIWFHTAQELRFPACPVAVQVCAVEAFANADTAVIHIYDKYFDCAS